MPFIQPAPQLPHPYRADPALGAYLRRALPPEVLADIVPSLQAMGGIALELHALSLEDRCSTSRATCPTIPGATASTASS